MLVHFLSLKEMFESILLERLKKLSRLSELEVLVGDKGASLMKDSDEGCTRTQRATRQRSGVHDAL